MASQPEQTWVHFQSFQTLLLMAPTNEKPNTLHSASIVGVHFGMGSSRVWHMALQKEHSFPEECGNRFHACDARGLVPETSISDRFFINAAILFFCVDAEKPARTLRHLCFAPHTSPLHHLVLLSLLSKREKKKNSKSEISTINFQSTLLSFSSVFFSLDSSTFLSLAALWLLRPAPPPVQFRCRSFYIC